MITRPRLSRIELYYDRNAQENYFVDLSTFMNKSFVKGLRFRVHYTSKLKRLSIYKGQFKMYV